MAALEAKLVQLNMAKNRTANILKANDYEKIERQQGTLKDLVSETNKCKNTVEEFKVVAKVSVEEIEAWNATVEDKVDEADREVARLKAWLNEAKKRETREQRLGELEYEHKLYETGLKLQAEFETSTAKSDESTSGNTEDQIH